MDKEIYQTEKLLCQLSYGTPFYIIEGSTLKLSESESLYLIYLDDVKIQLRLKKGIYSYDQLMNFVIKHLKGNENAKDSYTDFYWN